MSGLATTPVLCAIINEYCWLALAGATGPTAGYAEFFDMVKKYNNVRFDEDSHQTQYHVLCT